MLGKKKEEQPLVRRPAFGLATTELPAYMAGSKGQGFEHTKQEDFIMPRFLLVQALSPEIAAGIAKPGEIVHSNTKKNFGTEIFVIPVLKTEQWLLWKPRDMGGGLIATSFDGIHTREGADIKGSGLKGFIEAKAGKFEEILAEAPIDDMMKAFEEQLWTHYMIIPCITAGESVPVALSLSSTKMKVGRQLLSAARQLHPEAPLFGQKYRFYSVPEKSAAGFDYFNFAFESLGFCTDKEFALAKSCYNGLKPVHIGTEESAPEKTPPVGKRTDM